MMNTCSGITSKFNPAIRYELLTAAAVLFSSIFSACAPSQVEQKHEKDIAEARAIEQKVDELKRAKRFSDAIPLQQRAVELKVMALGPQDVEVAHSKNRLSGLYIDSSEYEKAEHLLLAVLADIEKHSPDHPVMAVTLNNLGELYRETQRYAQAESMYQRALAIYEKILGPEDPALGLLMNNLGLLYLDTHRYEKAEPILERAVMLNEKSEDDVLVLAFALNNIGFLYREIRQYDKAASMYERSLTIKRKMYGRAHPSVATGLSNLAEVYRVSGQYGKAEPLYLEAVRIWENALGPTHSELGIGLGNLAKLYEDMHRYKEAIPLLERALVIKEKNVGPENPRLTPLVQRLASIYLLEASLERALTLMQRALTITEKSVGREHPTTVLQRFEVSQILRHTGENKQADMLLEQNLMILDQTGDALDPAVVNMIIIHALMRAESLADYRKMTAIIERMERIVLKIKDHDRQSELMAYLENARTYLMLEDGNLGRSITAAKRTLATAEAKMGSDSLSLVDSLLFVSMLSYWAGNFADAEHFAGRALIIRERSLGPQHLEVAKVIAAMGVIYQAVGDAIQGQAYLNRAIQIVESQSSITEALYYLPKFYRGLANFYTAAGEYERARLAYEKALEAAKQAWGHNWKLHALDILDDRATLDAHQGHYEPSLAFLGEALAIEDEQIESVFTSTTEAEQLSYIEATRSTLDRYLSLICQHLTSDPVAVNRGFTAVLRRKGIVFDAQAHLRNALKTLPESTRSKRERLSALRSELSSLLLFKPETMSANAYNDKLVRVQQQIEEAERSVSRESTLAVDVAQSVVDINAVAKQLPPTSALIEFIRIRDFDFSALSFRQSFRYLAFILNQQGSITLIDLGETSSIDQEIRQTAEALKAAQKNRDSLSTAQSLTALTRLGQKLWVPLASVLSSTEQLIISPDGLLNVVPFAAITIAENKFLVEQYRLSYVASGRDLTRIAPNGKQSSLNLLLVANPSYDAHIGVVPSGDLSPVRSIDFKAQFNPLPGTEREAKEIPPLVSGHNKQILVGARATEGSVKVALSPHILHLATHGFFLRDQPPTPYEGLRGVSVVGSLNQSIFHRGPSHFHENPLVRSGVALAGANQAAQASEADDGILTALEVLSMDLAETDLVVLSACDTGVGTVQSGEGVFGLRRAFALAGAKNLLMSLWAVDDEITAEQMKTFYRNLARILPADALREAQLTTMKQLKANYGIASPALWAPFILQGTHSVLK